MSIQENRTCWRAALHRLGFVRKTVFTGDDRLHLRKPIVTTPQLANQLSEELLKV